MPWKRYHVIMQLLVPLMVVGQHGVVGHHAHQHVLVVNNIDREIVLILHHPMVVCHVLDHLLKLMVDVVIRHVVRKEIFERNKMFCTYFSFSLALTPTTSKFFE
jgi:hypothetical protein